MSAEVPEVTRIATGIGAYLRERRLAAGLTAAHLAARAGLTEAGLDQIETGAVAPNHPLLQRLFDALEVPIWYRKHIVALTQPSFFAAAYGPGPDVPTPDDQADLHSLPDPACYQRMPTQDLVEANSAYQRVFPGAVARGNVLEWMFLDAAARRVMVDWAVEAHLLVDAFRFLSPSRRASASSRSPNVAAAPPIGTACGPPKSAPRTSRAADCGCASSPRAGSAR